MSERKKAPEYSEVIFGETRFLRRLIARRKLILYRLLKLRPVLFLRFTFDRLEGCIKSANCTQLRILASTARLAHYHHDLITDAVRISRVLTLWHLVSGDNDYIEKSK